MSAFVLLASYLKRTIKTGTLTIVDANGKSHKFGDSTGNPVTVEITESSLYWKLVLFPDPAAGEAFMDGTLKMLEGTIFDLFAILGSQEEAKARLKWNVFNLWRFKKWRPNPIGKAQKNVAHHYDLSRQLFELFLDEDLQYSCAYYQKVDDSLDQAQLNKKQHIAAKLPCSPA